ncbi:MAG: ribonucleotide reductase N-terminal alpha domain-containing protein [Candidatus Lokiarchaeia archaeon]
MVEKSSVSEIRKRDGRIVKFEPVKITNAIHKAFIAVKAKDGETAKNLSDQVVAIIEENFRDRIPTVEEVQDIVEKVLIKNGFSDVAKAYILYRQKRTEIREAKKLLGVSDDLKLSLNATQVLEKRYLLKDDQGEVIETPSKMFGRVAKSIAAVDKFYEGDADMEKTEDEFYGVMSRFEFLPNSPTLMNAGTDIGQLSACFVIPVGDSIEEIFDALKFMALIHKSGGGTGFSFSKLRPSGDFVRSTKGVASGPVSFMRIYDTATDVIKQGGRRRGANMGMLRVDHPDIIDFISAKEREGSFTNFNLSVGVTDAFMEAIKRGEDYELINPRTGKPENKLKAATVFNLLVASAWRTGDPGLVFLDEINRHNPTPQAGQIESTNPCLAGDTLVATADGRGVVPIKRLAEEGKDIPVFTEDNTGKLTIRYMRRPRKTGTKKVYLITLDSGDTIKATGNHIFYLRDGTEKRTEALKPGGRLHVLTKVFQYQRGKYTINPNKRYWRMYNRGKSEKSEHTLIAMFFHNNGEEIPESMVIHHIDFDSENNAPENLEIMMTETHDRIHRESMKGENNSIYKIKANEEQWEEYKASNPFYNTQGENNPRYGVTISEETRTKISESLKENYEKNPDLKKKLSEISKELWKNKEHRQKAKEGFHKRALKKLKECLEATDLPCFLIGNYVFVEKICEVCQNKFNISYSKRETSYCSKKCATEYLNTNQEIYQKRTRSVQQTYAEKAEETRENQIECFLTLKTEFGREPLKKEWIERCKQVDIPSRLGTKYGFTTYRELKEAASLYNHKVISVEYIGEEPVYNGTVDEFHTFFIGGFKSKESEKEKITFIKTKNCGEVPLLPYESCNLGSINLSKMIKNSEVDWDKLRSVVRIAVHFLDNVIDANIYPLPQIERITKENRKIGLGVMGFAELLIQLDIPYDSNEAIEVAEKVMSFISEEARKMSEELALERGSFPNFDGSVWKERGYKVMRNATLTTIAPTGSISIIAMTSSGIEPLFAISFVRNIIGTQLFEVNPLFEKVAKERGFYSLELMTEIAKKGSVKNMENVPEDGRRVFVTALDIDPEWHVRMQAAFQKYVDNAVSKTVNLPQEATLDDVSKVFWLAYELKCKGITIFRYGSRTEQVLVLQPIPSGGPLEERYVRVDSEYAGGCPSRMCPL